MNGYEIAEIRGYLAAMIDGEGYVNQCAKSNGRGGVNRQVRIVNTDPAIIAHVCSCLEALEIDYSISINEQGRWIAGAKDQFVISIYRRESFIKLMQLPIQSAKLDRLSSIVKSYKRMARYK